MKKLFTLLLALLMLGTLCACGEETPETSTPEESSVACTHEHVSFSEVKVPTCTEKGLTQKVCDDCAAVLEETQSPAVGHVWAPKRGDDGSVTVACGLCGQVFDNAEVVPGA